MAEHGARRRRRGEGRRIRLDVRVDEAEHRGLVERAGARGVSIARLMIDAALEPAQWEWPETASAGVEGGGRWLAGGRGQRLGRSGWRCG